MSIDIFDKETPLSELRDLGWNTTHENAICLIMVLCQRVEALQDRNQPDEAWIPAHQKPPNTNYGWSDRMIICQFIPGDLRPTMFFASYDFRRDRWQTVMGPVENVTHWQPSLEFPEEYRRDE